uniref:Uncharacterized protein n=1 Tax=Quercus lobata TaxID=97700 RepID=A0A7N2KR07_QUELO
MKVGWDLKATWKWINAYRPSDGTVICKLDGRSSLPFKTILREFISDSYAIHETRRNVKSSIWVGCRGMEWILSCLEDIRDWVPSHVLLCKRFRENGKLLEFCERSNKAGLFVAMAVYFGGSRRGCIMKPASSNRAGGLCFRKSLGIFALVLNRYLWPKIMVVEQKSKNFENFGTISGLNRFHEDPSDQGRSVEVLQLGPQTKIPDSALASDNVSVISGNVSVKHGRSTRAFKFELSLAVLALRVCKPEDVRRVVTCLGDFVSPTTATVPEFEASLQVASVKLGFLGELDGDHPRTDGCTMTHFSSAVSHFSEGSDPHGSSEKSLMVFPGTDEMGGVLTRSDGCGGQGGAVDGLSVDPKSSGAEVGCMGFSVTVVDDPAEDFPNSGDVFTSSGQPVNGEPSSSPSLLVSGFSDMF